VVKDLDLDATIPWYINPGRAAGGMQVWKKDGFGATTLAGIPVNWLRLLGCLPHQTAADNKSLPKTMARSVFGRVSRNTH
jgi:hypothetical protein